MHDDEGGEGEENGLPAFCKPEKLGVPEPNQSKRKKVTLANASAKGGTKKAIAKGSAKAKSKPNVKAPKKSQTVIKMTICGKVSCVTRKDAYNRTWTAVRNENQEKYGKVKAMEIARKAAQMKTKQWDLLYAKL